MTSRLPHCTFPFLLLSLKVLTSSLVSADVSKIDPEVTASLKKGEKPNVIVFFQSGVASALESASAFRGDRASQNDAIQKALVENAETSQAGVVSLLSTRSQGGDDHFQYFKQFWSGNKLFIKAASADTINQVAEDPQVEKIVKEPIGSIPDPKETEFHGVSGRGPYDFYGIELMQVKEAWEELGGRKGEGVLVGTIDSGVMISHEALQDNFLGLEYGWFDAVNNHTEPHDASGHGTQTIGLLAGSHGIGVAPGVKYMTCAACAGGCPGEALLECLQFMNCPTLPDRTNPNCSRSPDILSNSWVSERGTDVFDNDILALRAKGVIPIFAIGNVGVAYCNKTRSPGDKPFVIGVGSAGSFSGPNWHTMTSSIGPASDGTIKPDIVAPGDGVLTSVIDERVYGLVVGTSMSTPYVAGVVALLKVRDPGLTYDQAYELLTENTDRNVIIQPLLEYRYCNESRSDVIPNNFWGYGRVNALKAVKAQTTKMAQKRAVK